MNHTKFALFCLLIVHCTTISCLDEFEWLDNLKSSVSETKQAETVTNLIRRTIPKYIHHFQVVVDFNYGPRDTYHIEKLKNGIIQIIGTTGVAAATGFHYYLKYHCKSHVSWEVTIINMPSILPDINITVTSSDRFRYYQNVCTASYSFVWWDIPQWEKHIDWMALNSYNLVLAFNGQEEIWRRVYKQLKLTDAEIDNHFPGPAFLAWGRMGNIRGWGGPLSKAWHNRSLKLQDFILDRMRNFGMVPVLPAFTGHVPRAFSRLYPNASLTKMGSWNSFDDQYCCPYILDPVDPLFKTVGELFLQELIKTFGTNHAYSSDTFNEMTPPSESLSYISNFGKAIYETMKNVDAKAVWLMQNWLFVHDGLYWTNERAKALLTSVPQGKMLVLDLQSEQYPLYSRFDSYFGQPFIWCMLHNFGGTSGMFGSAETINTNPFFARNGTGSTMVGTGITPEGINQNYVIYDLMSEMSWRKSPANLSVWFDEYTIRRYGRRQSEVVTAWIILKESVYNYKGFWKVKGNHVVNIRPSTHIRTRIWYYCYFLMKAWDLFLLPGDLMKDNEAYRYDVVDITRQVLQTLGDEYYNAVMKAYKEKDIYKFQDLSDILLTIMTDLERILSTNKNFMLGPWIKAAKDAASNNYEEILFEYNARNQITLWGPNGEIEDYASKQWSGLFTHLYIPRWSYFLSEMADALIKNYTFDENAVIRTIKGDLEIPFTFSHNEFPTVPLGDSIRVAKYIHGKYFAKGCKSSTCIFKNNGAYDPKIFIV